MGEGWSPLWLWASGAASGGVELPGGAAVVTGPFRPWRIAMSDHRSLTRKIGAALPAALVALLFVGACSDDFMNGPAPTPPTDDNPHNDDHPDVPLK